MPLRDSVVPLCVTTETRPLDRLGQLCDFELGNSVVSLCVTTETWHLDLLGQLGEFEQDSDTDSHSAGSKASTHGGCVGRAAATVWPLGTPTETHCQAMPQLPPLRTAHPSPLNGCAHLLAAGCAQRLFRDGLYSHRRCSSCPQAVHRQEGNRTATTAVPVETLRLRCDALPPTVCLGCDTLQRRWLRRDTLQTTVSGAPPWAVATSAS